MLGLVLSASLVPARLTQEDGDQHKEDEVEQERDDERNQEAGDEGGEMVDPAVPHLPVTGHPIED